MLEIIAGALLMTACAYGGVSIKRIFRIRRDTAAFFEEFVQLLKTEVRHLKTPVAQVIELYCAGKKGTGCDMLKKFLASRADGVLTASELKGRIKSIYLSEADNMLIASFLFALGRYDYESELMLLERYSTQFTARKKTAEDELVKKGGMYYKLGVLMGLALMIIVV